MLLKNGWSGLKSYVYSMLTLMLLVIGEGKNFLDGMCDQKHTSITDFQKF